MCGLMPVVVLCTIVAPHYFWQISETLRLMCDSVLQLGHSSEDGTLSSEPVPLVTVASALL